MIRKWLIAFVATATIGLGILSYCLNANYWLPPRISAPRGTITLVADYAGARSNSIDLFLINRTSRSIALPAQDGDIYVKLEALNNGTWTRAQKHVYSWCGNSYHTITLRAGSFLKITGYYPSAGVEREVRYKLYSHSPAHQLGVEVISNVGKGKVDPVEVSAAAVDTLAIQTGSFEFLTDIVRRHVVLPTTDHNKPRVVALRALGRYSRAETVPLLLEALSAEQLDNDELYAAWFPLMDVDKAAATEWTLDSLKDKNHRYRKHIVSNAWRLGEPGLMRVYDNIMKDYTDPAFLNAVANYAALKPAEAAPRLECMLGDPRLPAGYREQIQEILKTVIKKRP